MAKTSLKSKIQDRYSQILIFCKNNKYELVVLLIIVLVGAILRLYKIDQYMTFLGDEGRDVIVVRRLLVNLDPILIGPGTSVGNMYLGPAYYYMMAPFLLLANFNPVGPAILVALTGVATVVLVWFVARKWFPSIVVNKINLSIAGLSAAALYAVSPVVVNISRFSWNPNIMPFFSLLLVYSIWKFWKEQKWGWLIVAGACLGVMLQSHYLALIMIPMLGLFWLLAIVNSWKNKNDAATKKSAIAYSLASLFLFLLMMSPLVIFDARHGWRNFSAMNEFFLGGDSAVSYSLVGIISKAQPVIDLMFERLIPLKNGNSGILLSITFLLTLVWYALRGVKEKYRDSYLLLASWMLIGVLGLSFYSNELYDHYYGFLFPAPFLLVGMIAQIASDKLKGTRKLFVPLVLLILITASLGSSHLMYPPNKQMQRTKEIATKIAEESNGEKFNIAVIASENYEGAYWYFLEANNEPIIGIDPLRYEETVADQLFVVCEYEDREKCQPTSNPKAEVANFGWSKIDKQWEIGGIILFRLVHNIQ